MIINTKFGLKQIVWYLHSGKIQRGQIQSVTVAKTDSFQSESYSVYIGECGSVTTKRIDELFETKELFIESIS